MATTTGVYHTNYAADLALRHTRIEYVRLALALAGVVATKSDLSPVVGVLVAVLVTAAIGAFFGLPALRLKGLYLAIATIASQEIIVFVVRRWGWLTGGQGFLDVDRLSIFGWRVPRVNFEFVWYWVIAGLAVLAVLTARNLFRTALGRSFMAVRDHDV